RPLAGFSRKTTSGTFGESFAKDSSARPRFKPMSPVRSWFCFCSIIGLIGSLVMAEPELAQRMEALRAEIARHDELYFQQAAPEISDYDYDLLKRELRRLEVEMGAARPGETGIGDDRADGSTSAVPTGIVHGQPMLSLDKAYSEAEV